ncbi:MAG: bifunctional ornithine acetyltransferase/N-acetylglutamate synthase, partial [Proteobacteria bacterium]|nr:bifunctional ornithine acetyltransferase/N-acetylglutamate synthase [Pseudomonadota bacterium]
MSPKHNDPKQNEEKLSPLAPESFPSMPDVAGVTLAAGACGLKKNGASDLMVVELAPDTTAAGVFTRSLTASAPVHWSRKALRGGLAQGLIVNSGGANVFTGAKGMQAVERTVEAVADHFSCRPSKIFAASTGIIGEPLAFDKIIGTGPAMERVFDVMEKVALWRRFYNGLYNENNEHIQMPLDVAAAKVGISK